MSAEAAPLIHDISVLLGPGTPPWPGDTPYSCGWTWSIAAGASVNVSAVTASPHVGTHADAPLHVRSGAAGSDSLCIDSFIGRAIVIDVTSTEGEIPAKTVSSLLPPGRVERVLLRTGRSIATGHFPERWPFLSEDAVQLLLDRGLLLLGVDSPSVDDRESKALRVHHRLFDGGACILENLDLREIADGAYELIALPLKLAGLDASPVRALLRTLAV